MSRYRKYIVKSRHKETGETRIVDRLAENAGDAAKQGSDVDDWPVLSVRPAYPTEDEIIEGHDNKEA